MLKLEVADKRLCFRHVANRNGMSFEVQMLIDVLRTMIT